MLIIIEIILIHWFNVLLSTAHDAVKAGDLVWLFFKWLSNHPIFFWNGNNRSVFVSSTTLMPSTKSVSLDKFIFRAITFLIKVSRHRGFSKGVFGHESVFYFLWSIFYYNQFYIYYASSNFYGCNKVLFRPLWKIAKAEASLHLFQ